MISRSGEIGKSITIEGFPGERPIIDQQQAGGEDVPATGFILQCVSGIVLRNFEIRNVAGAGVSTSLDGCSSRHITLENLVIHDVIGGNLVAGIRIAGASDVTLRNNRLYNIKKISNDADFSMVASDDQDRRIELEQNTIHNVDNAILALARSEKALSELSIHHNILNDGLVAVAFVAGGMAGIFADVDLFGNVIYQVENALKIESSEASATSRSLSIHNNTFAKIDGAALVVDRFIDVSVLRNVFFQVDDSLLVAGDNARFDRIDYNLYGSPDSLSWTLGGAEPRTFSTFPDWRSVYSTEQPPALIDDPDVNGIVADPLFVDSEHADFHFQPGSPAVASGAGEERRGAYFDQGTVGASP